MSGDAASIVEAWSQPDILILTTHGSGSCPWIPELGEVDDETRTVFVTISAPGAEGECTADDAARTFELPTTRDLDGFTVEVTSQQDQ